MDICTNNLSYFGKPLSENEQKKASTYSLQLVSNYSRIAATEIKL